MIIYPDKIQKGNFIGITATSGGANLSKIDYSIKNLNNLGYKIIETYNVRKSEKLVSSGAEMRAKQFMSLWRNTNIKYIIAARGGEFLMEMIPYLDEYKDEIKKLKSKWVQGFSDTSLLLHYITTNYNIATVHAENIGAYAMNPYHKSLMQALDVLEKKEDFVQENFELYEINNESEDPTSPYNLTEKVEYKHLQNKVKDSFSGRLVGGCIDTFLTVIGTKYDKTKEYCSQFEEGMIWYIDNCELTATGLYRALWHMKQNGYFDNCNGFLIGRTSGGSSTGDFEYLDALEKGLNDLNIPVIYDVDIGHVAPQWTIINGSYGQFEFENGKGRLMQKFI